MSIRRICLVVTLFGAAPAGAQGFFEDVSAAAGFAPTFLANIPAGGVAVADYDRDGFPDIFVSGYLQPNRLYFNRGDGSFEERVAVTASIEGSRCSVAAAADFDNDGWPDLYVGCRGQSNLLLRNLGGSGFANLISAVVDHSPIGSNSARTDAVAWGDIDGNGLLDLYIGVYPTSSTPDLTDPDNLDRIVLQTAPGQWLNIAAGFTGDDRAKLGRTALAGVFSDFDGDGRVDLYVVNDKQQGNTLWRNEGAGCGGWCLREIAAESGAGQVPYGMGIAVADIDRDGDWDLWFSSIDEQFFLRGLSRAPLLWQHEPASVLNHYGVGWGTIFADFDNDGWQDGFLAVGSGGFSTTPNQDQLYRNDGGQFVNITAQSGALLQNRPTQAAAVIDFDRDGRLDLVLGHWNEGYRLYRNVHGGSGHWLAISLEGAAGINRDGLGTVVEVRTADGAVQLREMRAGESRGSSHDRVLHFGLGTHATAEVTVRWPDGSVELLGPMDGNQYHHHAQPQAVLFQHGFED
jgi:hypothetical protein